MLAHDTVLHRAGVARSGNAAKADPITTEVVRHALNSAANQMKRALVRTAFSPVIYEVLDFAVAIYDPQMRLLAQAPSLPMFMGTLNFCVEEAVKNIGGTENMFPCDMIMYNWPYGTGSHPQDLAVINPVYLDDGELIGYTAIKGHWLDIAGKDPYCTDTVDVFQEGTIYPGVKIYKRGELNDDIYRMVLANSRVPKFVAGDLNAQVVGCRVGAAGFLEVVNRFGRDEFRNAVENMFDHGERVVRSYFESIPDGRYVGHGEMDSNGITDDKIPFEVVVEIEGSNVRLDFSNVPETQVGPVNCPVPSTISASRVAISMLAGYGEAPHEGHFRPVEVVTRPGTMFHPLPPAPCFLYGWPALQAIEVIYNAISKALPDAVPAQSGGCICSVVSWGTREATGEPWADGSPHPTGQGAWNGGDGGTMLHISESATRFSPIEVWEAKNPWMMDKLALAQDSGGPGTWRGGLGVDFHFRMTEDIFITTAVERTKNAPWGLLGGESGRANGAAVRFPDGRVVSVPKTTRFMVPKDAVLELSTGGGGGFGDPAERPRAAVEADLKAGYISEAFAREHYPHAFGEAAE
ncbi:hydantoinase B/oxoprolinase family protein [Kaistia dalseonensis]|uniref:N-methylhydantoinase B n=1 Tax=Kaistia dalseonensis TaxID=410840 RepID=A0ABU0H838_9HYPH|nr:hydantoinase B/oxoprolinase family protein [Kaistia dalseonensis]MCX5495870.1 hydantoinase B/oxoprolinase family protein [Kaistia dalseonensis]MDQ0438471.1 N-methylhydantoinase B [Kaistia dalseonensis]